MTANTLTVTEVLTRLNEAVLQAFPTPVWVKGEIVGLNRTTAGAAFFRLADSKLDDASLEVMVRGRIMNDLERQLATSGLGNLRDGIEVRARGTVSADRRRSTVRLHLLEIDPEFTAGRLALDRAEVLRRMGADGSLLANGRLHIPDVPLRIGLVTSRGSAAHADFIDQLRRSGFRFRIKTAHTSVQGEHAAASIAAALERLAEEPEIDMVVLVRGGGSKLDLAAFDTELVARTVAGMPVPVLTGLGHEIDRSVTDEASALTTKTPSAAGEWLVSRLKGFSDRLSTARQTIADEARALLARQEQVLSTVVSDIAGGALALRRQEDRLNTMRSDIATAARDRLERQSTTVTSLQEWFSAISVDGTLSRGFAIVTRDDDGTVVRSPEQVIPGDRLRVRTADGTVAVTVEDQ